MVFSISMVKPDVTVSKIGNSFLTVTSFAFIGFIRLARPIIRNTLTIQLPIMFEKAI